MTVPHGSNRALVNSEFERAAATFGERTAGRFDRLDVGRFSRVKEGALVAEVGAGTGNFLALFAGVAARRVAVDLTEGMLRVARERDPRIDVVVADGARLPLASRSIDLVASAQALHHISEPLPVVKEMRRTVAPGGHVLIIDQSLLSVSKRPSQ